MGVCRQPNQFFQSAPCAIARHGISEPPGSGKPEARQFLIWFAVTQGPNRFAPGLKHEAPGMPNPALSYAQEFSAFFQAAQWDELIRGLHGNARTAMVMPRGFCGPWNGAARGLSCHFWLRCATGIRAVFCVPVHLVDMCVSHLNSMSLLRCRRCETKARNAARGHTPDEENRRSAPLIRLGPFQVN